MGHRLGDALAPAVPHVNSNLNKSVGRLPGSHVASVLPARMTQIMALMALTALGLSGSPVQEPIHG
jgi:hypothetical protein